MKHIINKHNSMLQSWSMRTDLRFNTQNLYASGMGLNSPYSHGLRVECYKKHSNINYHFKYILTFDNKIKNNIEKLL